MSILDQSVGEIVEQDGRAVSRWTIPGSALDRRLIGFTIRVYGERPGPDTPRPPVVVVDGSDAYVVCRLLIRRHAGGQLACSFDADGMPTDVAIQGLGDVLGDLKACEAAGQELFRTLWLLREDVRHGGRLRLEQDPASGWREIADRAEALKRQNPRLTWPIIADRVVGSLSTLKKYRRRRRDELARKKTLRNVSQT